MAKNDYIFVTVRTRDAGEYDLKISDSLKPGQLTAMVGEALGIKISQNAALQAEPLGRILESGRSLGDQGVENGALLSVI